MAHTLENTHGDRFEDLLPQITSDIDREVALLTSNITNGTVADNQKLTYLIDNEAELKRFIVATYVIAYSKSTSGAYAQSLSSNKDAFTDQGVPFGFRQDQLGAMSQIKSRNALLYNLEANKAADIIFDSILSWSYTGSGTSLAPFESIVGQMGASRHGSTIINTQISAFNRSVTAMAAEDAGVTKFLYVGPKAERPFCQHVLNGNRSILGISTVKPSGKGRVYTIEEISALNNGQTNDVLRTAGGFNCRHRWLPVQ